MRLLLIMGVVLLGLLAATFMLSQKDNLAALTTAEPELEPREVTLQRPLVLYLDGPADDALNQSLIALDATNGALADGAAPRSLMDVDVYVMRRKDWDVFRAVSDHDLAELIRENARDKTAEQGVAWFDATLTSREGVQHELLAILATDAARERIGPFCLGVTVYDVARFALNGTAFVSKTEGPGTHWKECHVKGWNSVADLPITE